MAGDRVPLLVLASRFGFQDSGFFGVAQRVLNGALMVISALSTVAFPALARERKPLITPKQLTVVGVLALGLGAGVWVLAPLGILVITGTESPDMVQALRILSVAVVLAGIEKPASAWALAKNRESALLWMAGIAEGLSLVVTIALVLNWGLVGAAIAVNARAAFNLFGVGAVVLDTVRRPATPS
jgi:O-antigen/teichoic acid export membrane protein